MEGLLLLLFPGAVAGVVTGLVVEGAGFGLLGDILIGTFGALIAVFVPPLAGIHLPGLVGSLIAPMLLGVILSLLVGAVRRL